MSRCCWTFSVLYLRIFFLLFYITFFLFSIKVMPPKKTKPPNVAAANNASNGVPSTVNLYSLDRRILQLDSIPDDLGLLYADGLREYMFGKGVTPSLSHVERSLGLLQSAVVPAGDASFKASSQGQVQDLSSMSDHRSYGHQKWDTLFGLIRS